MLDQAHAKRAAAAAPSNPSRSTQHVVLCALMAAASSHLSNPEKKKGCKCLFGPKIIITRLNAARCQLSDSLSTKVKLQEFAKLHAFEVDVSPCREFSIFRWIYF